VNKSIWITRSSEDGNRQIEFGESRVKIEIFKEGIRSGHLIGTIVLPFPAVFLGHSNHLK